MTPHPAHRLPAPLETAVQRVKLAAREAASRTVDSLGLAALSATQAFVRDKLLAAQFELNRKSAVFVLSFNDAFDERMLRDLSGRTPQGPAATEWPGPSANAATSARAAAHTSGSGWDTLSLVADQEVEAQISAERFGMDLAHRCEWELRELDAYVAALLPQTPDMARMNPLRPEIVGHAMLRGLHAVSEQDDVRKVLSAEIGRSLGDLLRDTYSQIVADWRRAGLSPASLTVRHRANRSPVGGGYAGQAPEPPAHDPPQEGAPTLAASAYAGPDGRPSGQGAFASGQMGTVGGVPSMYASKHSSASGAGGLRNSSTHPRPGSNPLGGIDPALMSVIRRLAFVSPAGPAAEHGQGHSRNHNSQHDSVWGVPHSGDAPLLPNLIREHRDELRQATQGSVDHMVIDVIGFLFDQILSDPKVPPQMARLLARLQLPVLRAALGDPSFFSSRKHPVRRLVNRIASLGAAFDDFEDAQAQAFLAKVRSLVQGVVEGDFEQMALYEQQLAALESFVAEQNAQARADQNEDSSALLAQKEDEQRLRQLYAERLADDLKDVAAPAFLRDFVSRVWSQVLLRASEREGPGAAPGGLNERLRHVGRDLFLSVQPKPTPAKRKAFLADLPKLMQALTEGMDLVAWPAAERRNFFGQLMPAHAEALKAPASRELDINLMARRVEGALAQPVPQRADLPPPQHLPVLHDVLATPAQPSPFSAEEAQRLGWVDESAVNWQEPAPAPLDIDLSLPADAADLAPRDAASSSGDGDIELPGLPSLLTGSSQGPQDDALSAGRGLADHVQIGFAYHMHLQGQWQKVRLTHISPARGFFMFSHGAKQRQTLSLTYRMLVRLCDEHRFRAIKHATLSAPSTPPPRRQLAALAASVASASAARPENKPLH
jgi:Protein of unknown function (DUF1631)